MKGRFTFTILFLLLYCHSLAQQQSNRSLPSLSVDVNVRLDSAKSVNGQVGVTNGTDTLHGAQLSLLLNGVRDDAKGVMIAGVGNGAAMLSGVQIAGLSNVVLTRLAGVQISAVSNVAMGVEKGLQWGMTNVSSGMMRGLQVGAYNYADTLSGLQMGLINVGVTGSRGVQVGLVNYSRDAVTRSVGLINISRQTRIDYLLGMGTASKVNAALRFRNRNTYTIMGVGTHYMGFDDDFSAALYYRFGRYFSLTPRWTLSTDLGFYHVESFQKRAEAVPERLYSLQAHVTVDYQWTPLVGTYLSLGYGTTRFYGSHHNFRTRPIVEAGVTLRYKNGGQTLQRWEDEKERDLAFYRQQHARAAQNTPLYRSDDFTYQRQRWWPAVVGTVGINALVHSFDRFVLKEDFAQVHFKDIGSNWRNAFVWDNDQFSTNLFAHPYHGNLYYNAARSNGLSFWQSAPFAFGGSLMWEMCGEVEPPAINDLIATSVGGICIGEIAHRVSALILNDKIRGRQRFWREVLAGLINPMQLANRLVNGDAWRVRDKHYLYHDFSTIPVEFLVSVGNRYLADQGSFSRGTHQPYVELSLYYGDVLGRGVSKPYDFFTAQVSAGFTSNQPFIHGLHLKGLLWGRHWEGKKREEGMVGLFQHFNYYDSKPIRNGSTQTPYRISEAASVGPGLVIRFPKVGNLASLRQELYLDAILLGGTKSDYYSFIDRDYNMGSGYSMKSQTFMVFPRLGAFSVLVDYYRIYTWKGYERKDLSHFNPLFLNAQGDQSNAQLLVVRPRFLFQLKNNFGVDLTGSFFVRSTHYKYYANVQTNTFEVRAGLVYRL